jgi:antitoxin component YwqK of YwqJK toxin-antitoxin module
MVNINQVDELGRKQGLWIRHYPDGDIFFKCYYLNSILTNYYQFFYIRNSLSSDEFYHTIF